MHKVNGMEHVPLSAGDSDFPKLISTLVDYANADGPEELSFTVLNGDDELLNRQAKEAIERAGSSYKRASQRQIAENILSALERDIDSDVRRYGINFGGSNFYRDNGKIMSGFFNLLAVTVSGERFAQYITEG